MTSTPINAFVTDCEIASRHASDGPLSGMTFGVKDLLDVAGVPTGAGNPDWRRTHAVPERTAPSVARLLDAGARLVGKTITDELAWDLDGENAHHGTPVNVAAPGRIPGGSSSGSAAATAAGLCDFAIGTDTGGSVRLPASFCGLYGIRPPMAASRRRAWFRWPRASTPSAGSHAIRRFFGRSPKSCSALRARWCRPSGW